MRKIHCSECKTHLGEIKDARLKKGIAYLCAKCETARNLMKAAKTARNANNPLGNIFDIFNQ